MRGLLNKLRWLFSYGDDWLSNCVKATVIARLSMQFFLWCPGHYYAKGEIVVWLGYLGVWLHFVSDYLLMMSVGWMALEADKLQRRKLRGETTSFTS